MKKNTVNKTTLYIKGMHCPSCDILVKDRFKECANVTEVKANHKNQTAEISYTGQLNTELLNKKIQPYGYSIAEKTTAQFQEPYLKRFTDAAAIGVILFIAFYFLQQFNILPNFSSAPSLSFVSAFILGLVASMSTCMATSGALFLATIGKLEKPVLPALSFTFGRVISYGVFGFIAGMIGKAFFTNAVLGSLLTLLVSVIMVLIALDMLKLISFSWVSSTSFTKPLFEKLRSKFMQRPREMAFLLGFITYLLPCGFTQSVQVYSLGLANPTQSALMMMAFALGTVPALLAVGVMSSFSRSAYYPIFVKVVGVVILFVGMGYVFNFTTLRGINFSKLISNNISVITQAGEEQDGYQVIRMSVNSAGYSPTEFTVKQGKPVKWIVNGKTNFGCQTILTAPQIGVSQYVKLGDNIITFLPNKVGDINFSCEMGMYRGQIHVVQS